jgi:RNase P/RNase MRP subunit p30
VFGNGNEKKFIQMAEKLGYKQLIVLYPSISELKKSSSIKSNLSIKRALLIDTANKNKVITLIKEAKKATYLSFVIAQNPKFDRFIVERTDATGIVNVEFVHPKDHLHFRRSGLDQVICRFAHKNKKVIASSFSQLLKDKRNILGRVAQNKRLCKKYKVDYIIGSFATTPLEMIGLYEKNALLRML